MWVKRKELEELKEKVRSLEEQVWVLRAPHGAKIGRVVSMILDHLGVSVERRLEHDYIHKKGGPERGE